MINMLDGAERAVLGDSRKIMRRIIKALDIL